MNLDVGCGFKYRGHVNIDLYPNRTIHRKSKITLNKKKIPNFIQADCCHLPFRSNIFDTVFSFHTIEHISNPILMLKEMIRVSKDKIIIKCPHRLGDKAKEKLGHEHFFNRTILSKILKHLEIRMYNMEISKYYRFPHKYIPIIQLPQEIKITIYKVKQ